MLAPFFDGMITDDVKNRFTAQAAYDFLCSIDESLSDEQRLSFTPRTETGWKDIGRRWDGLPKDFVEKWSSYARLRPRWTTRLLRWVCRNDVCYRIILWIRSTLRV